MTMKTNYDAAYARLDQFIEQQMKAGGIPGMAVALTDRRQLLRVSTCGLANLEAGIPLAPETLFEIGSVSKSFTCILLLQLQEEGRLSVHDPVTRYLPWFEVPSPYGPIALHHLMSHTAGIVRGTEFTGEAQYETWVLRHTEATSPPGARFYYSNTGFKALGLVLEAVTGQPYADLLQERILIPLGMTATHPVIKHCTREGLAVGYEAFYDDRPRPRGGRLAPATWQETATADGSIAATPADLAVYLRTLMNRAQMPGGQLLSEDSFALMTQRVIRKEDSAFYGYGLSIEERDGHTIIGHNGSMVGYKAHILADLDEGVGAVVMINGPGEPEKVARYALALLRAACQDQNLPPLPPDDPTRVENAADYVGTFRAGEKQLTATAEGEHLILHHGGEQILLEKRGDDQFYVNHPDFALFLLRFQRDEDRVLEAFHGADWYIHEDYAGPTAFDHPSEWHAYVGHYRSYNPWYSNSRIVLRKGALWLIHPSGLEQRLVPLREGVFRVGEEEHSPERICFETLLKDRAIRVNFSGGDYYRTFTP